MNKEGYFNISKQLKLPHRCPILDYCQRRAFTLYFFGEYRSFEEMLREGTLPDDFDKQKIMFRGEEPGWAKGDNVIQADNMCPEVNLFDSFNALPFVKDTACSTVHWDGRDNPEISKNVQTHYSECAEFSFYSYHRPEAHLREFFSSTFYSIIYEIGDSGLYKMGVTDNPDSLLPPIHDEQQNNPPVLKKECHSRKEAQDYIDELKKKYKGKLTDKELYKLSAEEIEKLLRDLSK